MADSKPTVIAIVGPTCSGKTSLSIEMAQELNSEIIACDSRTVFKYFDIGTAKPTLEERQGIPHHLIDVAEPDEQYTVAQFTQSAQEVIEHLAAQNRIAIVCGGTGFYSRALLEGLSIPAVAPQEELRAELYALADREGNQVLHDRLRTVDPTTADRLNVNDRFRIVRAIEVSTVSGQPFSELAGRVEPPFHTIWIGLTAEDRNHLYAAIRERFVIQMEQGMLDETRSLYERYGPNQKIMNTVNYKELVQHIEGEIDLPSAEELALKHNYHLARRQLIWFRANERIKWFAIDKMNKSQLRKEVSQYITSQL